MSEPLDPNDPFERELTDRLEAIVHGEAAPFELVDRAAARSVELAHRRRLRRGVTSAGLAALVTAAVWLLAVASPIGNGTRHQDAFTLGPNGERIPVTTTTQPRHPTSSTSSSTSTSTTRPGETTTTTARPGGTTGGGPGGTSTTTTSLATTVLSTLYAPDGDPEPRCVQVTGKPNSVHDDWDAKYRAYWTSAPDQDQPLTLKVCIDDVTPAKGQQVTVTVTVDDPDQLVDEANGCPIVGLLWGDEDAKRQSSCHDMASVPPTAPSKPPAPGKAGHLEKTFTHTYAATGSRTIQLTASSGPDAPGPQPYSSDATAELPIVVH